MKLYLQNNEVILYIYLVEKKVQGTRFINYY